MPWSDSSHLQAAAVCLVACAALAATGPALVARLPEPVPEPDPALESEADVPEGADATDAAADGAGRKAFARTLPEAETKELYADLAARPHLALWLSAAAAVVGAVFGLTLGWTGALLYLVPLVPVGVVLVVVDWRTTLLPNRIMYPAYGLMAVLVPLAALVDQDLDSLYRAGWGWLVVGGWFWAFWFVLNAWGFGDVRLARVLGPALGYLGWSQLLMGLGLMLLVGAAGGLVVAAMRGSLKVRVPYGPWMLLGAALAVVVGPGLAGSLGY